jgi:glycosyltransferase involved in cell wall biosynthesis
MLTIDILLPSSSQYSVIHHFANKLSEAFVRQGAKCRLLSGDERIFATLNNRPDFTIGFNGALKMEDGSLFCDQINVPHVSCLVDPPFRFLELTKSPNIIIACDDQEGCALLINRGFERTVFMPHAVEPELAFDPKIERIYDIVFLGTCIDAEKWKKQWKKRFSPQIVHLMEEAANVCLEDDVTSFMSVLLKHLDPVEYQEVFEAVELYVKGVDRLDLLRSFPDSTVHVFGTGMEKDSWKKIFKKDANMVIHPPVMYDEALEVMKRSKVVLNSSIKNKFGAHERVFSAAACGAIVVTNDNPWIREHFRDGKELLLYDRHSFKELGRRVKELLENERKRRTMAAAGRRCVMKGHTWDHRVKQLLQEILPMLYHPAHGIYRA